MTRQLSGSEVIELLRKEISPDKINKLLGGLEVGVTIGQLTHLVNTAFANRVSDDGAIRGAVYEDVELTCSTLRSQIGVPVVIGHERAEVAHNVIDNLLAAIRARRAQQPGRHSMGFSEYNLRLIVNKLGARIEGEELDEDELIRMAKEIQAVSGVCSSCGGSGQDGDEDGGTYACDTCKGAGIIVPPEQYDPELNHH